ncbi:MAG TPA: hypothetical protein VM869_35535 [Enhygromyxa sp.]|nr:hypothetical protein [Enhygromyxa sp.]
MLGSCAALLLATTLAPPSDPPAPGGYWSISEQRQRRGEPPDGDDELTIGSVLFSLGLLRTGAAAVTIWMARTPDQCPTEDPAGCRPMEIYGWFGVGEGGLMVGTGLTYLIIGAVRQRRYNRWHAGESVMLMRPRVGAPRLELGPWMLGTPVDPVGGGAQLRLRF